MTKPVFRDYLQLHFIVLIFGFTAILGKSLSVHPLSLVFFRTGMAAFGMGLVLYFRGVSLAVSPQTRNRMLVVGMIIGFHWLLFFLSGWVATASISLAGFATTSLFTAFVEPILLKRAIRRIEVFLSLVIVAGLLLIFTAELRYFLGLMLGVASAFGAAVFASLNAKLMQENNNPLVITFYEMLGACATSVICLPIFYYFAPFPFIPHGLDWLWLLILALVCTVYAHTTGTALMRKFSAFAINLTVNLEPVYGIVLAFVFFGEKERMTLGFYLGTLVVLLAVLSYPYLNKWLLDSEQRAVISKQ